MYNVGVVELGQISQDNPSFIGPVKPTAIDNIFSVLEKGLQTGLTVYDKIKQLENIRKARKQTEEQAKMLAQLQQVQASVSTQPTITQSYTGFNLTTLMLFGGGILLLSLILKK